MEGDSSANECLQHTLFGHGGLSEVSRDSGTPLPEFVVSDIEFIRVRYSWDKLLCQHYMD